MLRSVPMKPLSDCPRATLAAIRGVLTDIDETVSTAGHLTAEAYAAMAALKKAGLLVIVVTGRPAGWCDLIARFWPVDGVVGENGAFYFRYDHRRRVMVREFLYAEANRAEDRKRLLGFFGRLKRVYPDLKLASDQPFR